MATRDWRNRARMALAAIRGRPVVIHRPPRFPLEHSFFPPKRLAKVLEREGRTYRGADPFPHVVIDGLIEKAALRTVLVEFGKVDETAWKSRSLDTERKRSNEAEETFGPYTTKLIHTLNSGNFLRFLERLTGVEGLIADPYLRGGGLHEIRQGGKLDVHADFNLQRQLRLYRRLNLLLYLNRDWDDAWGGHLELWDRDLTRCARRIVPLFNRTVIFNTTSHSYHGHPEPLACPDKRARRSIAVYYYTVECPPDTEREPHTTIFQQLPAPAE